MKKLIVIAGLVALFGAQSAPVARAAEIQPSAIALAIFQNDIRALDLINWKVGDSASYDMALGAFGKGSMEKSITSEENGAIWMTENISILGQKQLMEVLIRKSDGKILKMKMNGQDQAIPDDKIEIISQEVTSITVPAGKFQCVHIVAKTKDVAKIELWANPQDTVMDGALKMIQPTPLGVDVTIELNKFHKVQ
ncbi:MAG: hypothetical protein AABZ55_10740 [Bdellovibrionota bacterium]